MGLHLLLLQVPSGHLRLEMPLALPCTSGWVWVSREHFSMFCSTSALGFAYVPKPQRYFLPSFLPPTSSRLLLFVTQFLLSLGWEVGRHFLLPIFRPSPRQALCTLVSGVGPSQ